MPDGKDVAQQAKNSFMKDAVKGMPAVESVKGAEKVADNTPDRKNTPNTSKTDKMEGGKNQKPANESGNDKKTTNEKDKTEGENTSKEKNPSDETEGRKVTREDNGGKNGSGVETSGEVKETKVEDIKEVKKELDNNSKKTFKSKIDNIVNKIPEKYKKNGQCDSFAKKMVERLKKENIHYQIIRVDSIYSIYSDKAEAVIGNGYHYGIKINDIIYDNMTPEGIKFDLWLEDLGLTSQPKEIINWSEVDVILNY